MGNSNEGINYIDLHTIVAGTFLQALSYGSRKRGSDLKLKLAYLACMGNSNKQSLYRQATSWWQSRYLLIVNYFCERDVGDCTHTILGLDLWFHTIQNRLLLGSSPCFSHLVFLRISQETIQLYPAALPPSNAHLYVISAVTSNSSEMNIITKDADCTMLYLQQRAKFTHNSHTWLDHN